MSKGYKIVIRALADRIIDATESNIDVVSKLAHEILVLMAKHNKGVSLMAVVTALTMMTEVTETEEIPREVLQAVVVELMDRLQ